MSLLHLKFFPIEKIVINQRNQNLHVYWFFNESFHALLETNCFFIRIGCNCKHRCLVDCLLFHKKLQLFVGFIPIHYLVNCKIKLKISNTMKAKNNSYRHLNIYEKDLIWLILLLFEKKSLVETLLAIASFMENYIGTFFKHHF